MSGKSITIILLIAGVLIFGYNDGWFDNAVGSQQLGDVDYTMSLTGQSGGTLDDSNKNNLILTITNSTVSSTNDTDVTFNLNLIQKDGENDANRKPIVRIKSTGYEFDNIDDTTDTTVYRTMNYTTANGYHTDVNGTLFESLPHPVEIDYSETDVVPITMRVEQASNLDKGIENAYDTLVVGTVSLDGGKSVVVKYVQTG